MHSQGVGGLALGKDGRLFMAGLDLAKREGAILACSSDTDKIETIIPVEAGFWPNDLVLAPDGGFYFSDFHGSATDASGGVYYVSPDFRSITPVIKNLAQANGVFISCCFSMYNSTKEFELNRIPICEHHYGLELKNSPQEAARCNDCGECSWQCPQGIDIPTQLRKVARHFANVKVGW